MAVTKILISVKTYPTLSKKYDELVCTAGFREDGSWIRIYPIPYRKLQFTDRYKKWQWIEIDVVRNNNDFRKESFRPVNIDSDIILGNIIGPNNWNERKEIVLKNVRYNMDELIAEAKNSAIGTSLAVLKPKEIKDFIWEEEEREWDKDKLAVIYAHQRQGNLFEQESIATKRIFQVVKKLPYKFSYVFTTEDGKERTLMIEDWEVGELYWNCLSRNGGDEIDACKQVKKKFFDWMAKERDLYFFLGTTQRHHNYAKNPFIIIGAFYPPKMPNAKQLSLDL